MIEIEYKPEGLILTESDGTIIKLDLENIINKCNEAKVKSKELVLLEIFWDGGRDSDIYEQRIMTKDNANLFVRTFVGVEIYFGEIRGKHSEVYGDLEVSDITINSNPESVKDFLASNPLGYDYNHSFIDIISDGLIDGTYEDIDMSIEEFNDLFVIS